MIFQLSRDRDEHRPSFRLDSDREMYQKLKMIRDVCLYGDQNMSNLSLVPTLAPTFKPPVYGAMVMIIMMCIITILFVAVFIVWMFDQHGAVTMRQRQARDNNMVRMVGE